MLEHVCAGMKCLSRKALRIALLACLTLLVSDLATHQHVSAQKSTTQISQPPATQDSGSTITLTISVTEKHGESVYGLKPDAFTILDNKTPQKITSFVHKDMPASIGILFDASGSMDDKKLSAARAGLAAFIQAGNQESEYFLMGFNQRPQLLMDWTDDGAALLTKLKDVQSLGQTSLYDSCNVAIDKVIHGRHQRHIIILITDGQDSSSRYSADQVFDALKRSDVVVYSVGLLGETDPGLSALTLHAQSWLSDMALISGGRAFFPADKKQTDASFDFISKELHYQYLIGFTPANVARDGKWHRLKVDVTLPPDVSQKLKDVQARTRQGYYGLEK
jgi:Ca-activated chloride channel family protein